MTSRVASERNVPATDTRAGAPPVSIVIPARNEEQSIAGSLEALARQTFGPERLEVIVVVAGDDRTAEVAARVGADRFHRLDVVRLAAGNKNAALVLGCGRARGALVVLLDADTELAADAVDALIRAQAGSPTRVVHGAALPRHLTWVSRYWELNRMLTKDLRFDGQVSGELVALPRAALQPADLPVLFPDRVGAKDDLHLGRALAARGCVVAYETRARATTLVPWTLGGLATTMLRNRRGTMAVVSLGEACAQAAASALVVGALPVAALLFVRSPGLAALALTPLVVYVARRAWQVEMLRRAGFGDHRRDLPGFLCLDLLGRALKLWAFGERLAGRSAPITFRGSRPAPESAAPVDVTERGATEQERGR
jgi:hypothetical protein